VKQFQWSFVWAGCLIAGQVCGAGFQLYTEGSAEALGQGGAVSGRTNLISLAWYNPSALAGTDRPAIMLGNSFVQINTVFFSDNGEANDSSMKDDWRSVPHFYYVQPFSGQWTGMISVNAPYGLITEWPDGWIGNLAAVYSELTAIYTTPSIAYRISEKVALSAGFNIVYADAELTASRDLSPGPNFGERKVTGDDFGFGYTASAHWNIAEDWAAGARYQSRVKLTLDGEVKFDANPVPPNNTKFDGEADLTLPSSVNFGVANSSIDKLHLGLDLVWTEWSTYDELPYEFGAGYPLTNPEIVPKRWDNVWSVRLGGEYELAESWALRAGYVWDESPVVGSTRSPELPGSDRHMLMGGVGWKWNNMSIDMAYAYLWGKKVDSGSLVNAATGGGTAGEYETYTHLISLSASYTF